MKDGQPVISVDAKKKELVGEYSNAGKEFQPKGTPARTKVHDFIDPEMGKAIPYGVYDLGADEGWVSVGDDADTAGFAVATISRWWAQMGSLRYPDATRLLVCADAGGSNGYRIRAWKVELAKLARETGLEITVCHYPPGTSKWNKIEHRLFSFITMNSRGRPLTSYRVIVQLIANTTTKKGLKVQAGLDQGYYPNGVKITNKELAAVPLTCHEFQGVWTYTVHPQPLKQFSRGPLAQDVALFARRLVLLRSTISSACSSLVRAGRRPASISTWAAQLRTAVSPRPKSRATWAIDLPLVRHSSTISAL
jgi:hypothetical protein